jgi:GTPase SAR1 family protein
MFVLGIGDESSSVGEKWQPQSAPSRASDYQFRIIISGDNEVGKTALARRIVKNEFNPRLSMYNIGEELIDIAYAHLARGNKLAKILLIDIHSDNYKKLHKITNDAPYQGTVAFIVCNMHDTKKTPDFESEIEPQVEALKAKYTDCKFVLVCTKTDTLERKKPFLIKYIAERAGFIGAAMISAKTGWNIPELMTLTIEKLAADLEKTLDVVRERRASFFKEASPSTPSTPLSSSSPPSSSPESSSETLHAIFLAEEQRFIPLIQARIAELEQETLAFFSTNKPRKLQKLYALNELLTLIRIQPDISIATHIESIRKLYADKGLDEGEQSRTKELLDSITHAILLRPYYKPPELK